MSTKAKVIFVNSFKGGAGKTTLALTHCIDNLFHGKELQYDNTIYMDLDVLGTGTCYLFKDGILKEEACFEETEEPVEVQLEMEDNKSCMYVAYLNPVAKTRSLYGTEQFINHQGIAAENLKYKVLKFIKKQIEAGTSTLIVLDCAPGFTSVEQAILQECYQMKMKSKLEIEEDYVTTLDSAHMQKCIHCLNDSIIGFPQLSAFRDIKIVINDFQNYSGYKGIEKAEEEWKRIVKKIRQNLKSDKIKIMRWKYSEQIAQNGVYGIEGVVENNLDCYIFTDDNYKEMVFKEPEVMGEEEKKGVE